MSQSIQLQPANSVSIFPSPAEWAMLKEQATMLVKSRLLPSAINSPEAAIAVALKGRELGIPPMQAFAHVHIINQKPTISSELMLSLIFKNCPGAVIDYIETTDKACVIEARRPGGKKARFSFTIENARVAGLLGKGPWQSYPGAMLRARAIAIVARALFPDAIMGCSYTPEEMGAEVDGDGEVITIPTESSPSAPPAPAPAAAKPQIRTRGVIAAEIQRAAAAIKLEWLGPEMHQWVENLTGKTELKSLTEAEMERFLADLNKEAANEAAKKASTA